MNRRLPLALLLAALVIAAAAWPWLCGIGEPSPLQPDIDSATVSLAPPEPASADFSRTQLAAPATRPDFRYLLERLVETGTRLSVAVDARDQNRAEELDRQSRSDLATLYRFYPEPEERALLELTGLSPTDAALEQLVRRRVCVLLLTQGLERRFERSNTTRRHLDSLVSALLATLPQNEKLAQELGTGLLADRPYLGLAHEDAVLDLLVMASELPWLREVSTALLLTLWDNLLATGARTDSELAVLALLFKDDVNPSRRLAALVHLLSAEDGRYRDLVIEETCARKEGNLARELGLAAAESLPPDDAIEVLERLATISAEALMPAFVRLGLRDPEVLRTAYDRSLADNLEPGLRAELVTGTTFSPAGIELARHAFHVDPHPAVRSRAMLSITANAAEAWGEETLSQALDDPELCSDPRRLGAMVWALDNLSSTRGMTEAVQRLGTRLMSLPDLLAADREHLAEILSR